MRILRVVLRRFLVVIKVCLRVPRLAVRGILGAIRSRVFWLGGLVLLTLASLGLVFSLERTDSGFQEGDRQFTTGVKPKAWDRLSELPESLVVERLGYEDEVIFRKALAAQRQGRSEEAIALWLELSESDDPKLASYANTILGKIAGELGLIVNDPKLLEAAVGFFAQAIYLDDANEDAKFDLEKLYKTAQNRNIPLGPPKDSGEGDEKGNKPNPGAGFEPPVSGY